jgi:ABC-type branched-subunit amino acid transport system ATPase component
MLELDSITAGYGELTVLSDLSISLKKGETVCLIGQMVPANQQFYG